MYIGLHSQNHLDSEWVLGTVGGVVLNFDTDYPTITNLNKDFGLRSANASISDEEGDLLFYSNGCKIFSSNFEVMMNGDSLSFSGNPFCDSSDFGSPLSQSVMIVPHPNNVDQYFLLHSEFTGDSLEESSLFYSVIDMNLNNGLGEVVSKRNVILTDKLSRAGFEMTKHDNGIDWWIIIPRFESNCYHTFLLTSNGIESEELQCLGIEWSNNDVQGQMDVSPDGNKFARFIYEHGLNIFDFNTTTGKISNPIRIDFSFTETVFHTGVIFSPNSRFVYASAFDNVYQYDFSDDNIEESRVKVATLTTPDSLMFPTRFKQGAIAANNKIYIGGSIQFNHLHVIHNPDCKGVLCNLEQYAIQLNEFPHFCAQGVPNIPHFRNRSQDINCDTVDIVSTTSTISFESKNISIYPNPVDDLLTIEIENIQAEFELIKIVSILGQEIMSVDINKSSSNKIQISTATLDSGMYYLLFIDAQGKIRARKKVVRL